MSERTITACKIGPYPKTFSDTMPVVEVTYNDGSSDKLFSFYPDEIFFRESEFIGLTRGQAMDLRHRKDVAYLRS